MSFIYEPFNGFQNQSQSQRSQFYQQNVEKFMSPFMSVSQKPPVNLKEAFEVSVDVQQFQPHELSVKVTEEHVVTVEGKHGEKRDQHGTIQRHFVRKYNIPTGYDTSKIESKLSSDGILTILVGKFVKEKPNINVPIRQTYMPRNVAPAQTNGTNHTSSANATKMDHNQNHHTVVDHQKMAETPKMPEFPKKVIAEEGYIKPVEKIITVQREQTPESSV